MIYIKFDSVREIERIFTKALIFQRFMRTWGVFYGCIYARNDCFCG